MDDRDDFVGILLQQLLDPLHPDRGAPGKFLLGHLCAQALGHVGHPVAEHAVFQDQHLVAGLHRVDKGSLHAQR